jgi:hypothetical protein
MRVLVVESTEQEGILTLRDPEDGRATTVRVNWTKELKELGVQPDEEVEMTFSRIVK